MGRWYFMFDWDKKIMQENLDKLLKKSNKNAYDEQLIEFYTYNLMSNTLQVEPIYHKMKTKEVINEIKYDCDALLDIFYKLFPKTILNQLYLLIEGLGQMSVYSRECEKQLNIKKCRISDEFKDISYDTFLSLSLVYKEYLDYIYSNNLVKVKKSNDKVIYPSECHCDFENNMGFVYINSNHKYSNEAVFNHELTHSLTTILNKSLLNDQKLVFLSEAHSIFIGEYTNNRLYEKTKDKNYLIANYNYCYNLKMSIFILYFYLEIAKLPKITLSKLSDIISARMNIKFDDDKNLKEFLFGISQSYPIKHTIYLLSSLASIHMLNQDEEKQKNSFNKSMLTNATTIYNFFKTIDYPVRDKYYACEMFNRYEIDKKSIVRERK